MQITEHNGSPLTNNIVIFECTYCHLAFAFYAFLGQIFTVVSQCTPRMIHYIEKKKKKKWGGGNSNLDIIEVYYLSPFRLTIITHLHKNIL